MEEKRAQNRWQITGSGIGFGKWQLRVPSKIKVFGWRACLNILPSKVNLVRRQILKEDRCGLCQRCLESVIHAVWECSAAQDVWAGSTA